MGNLYAVFLDWGYFCLSSVFHLFQAFWCSIYNCLYVFVFFFKPRIVRAECFVSHLSLAEKMEATAQLKELVSDLSSQFVVSPPALRTRRKNVSSASKLLDELVRNV